MNLRDIGCNLITKQLLELLVKPVALAKGLSDLARIVSVMDDYRLVYALSNLDC